MTYRASLFVAVFLLILGYVAGYFALVQEGLVLSSRQRACPVEYRFGGEVAARIFFPIHAADRRLRPWVWGSKRERNNGSPWRQLWRAHFENE